MKISSSFVECITKKRWSKKGVEIPSGKCRFPFRYKDREFHKCTRHDTVHAKFWCSTELHDGSYVDGKWGECTEGCSKEIKGICIY